MNTLYKKPLLFGKRACPCKLTHPGATANSSLIEMADHCSCQKIPLDSGTVGRRPKNRTFMEELSWSGKWHLLIYKMTGTQCTVTPQTCTGHVLETRTLLCFVRPAAVEVVKLSEGDSLQPYTILTLPYHLCVKLHMLQKWK